MEARELRARLHKVTGGRPLPPIDLEAVAEKTAAGYELALRRFVADVGPVVWEAFTAADLDWWATTVASRWADTAGVQQGVNLQSALLHFLPEVKGSLPLLSRGIKGWRNRVPERERDGLSETAVGAIADWLCGRGDLEGAALTVIVFDALLRDQDWNRLRTEDISDDGERVALQLGVFSRDERCKTGFEQGVVLLRPAATQIARALRATRHAGQRVFSLTDEQFRTMIRQATMALGIPSMDNGLEWVPHCLRHGGASEFHRKFNAPALDIQLRGRWDHIKSVKRYTKPHKLIALDAALSAECRERAARFWTSPASRLCR
jgi:hypothetical protein